MIIPVGFGQVTHVFQGEGVPQGAAVTYGVDLSVTNFGQNQVAFAHNAFALGIMPLLSNTIAMTHTILKYGPQSTGPTFESSVPVNGGEAGSAATPQVAYLVKKTTPVGGRSGRGRMYLPGVVEGAVNESGIISNAFRGDLQDGVEDFLEKLDVDGVPMVLLSSVASDAKPVTRLDVDTRVATQRRRLR